VAGLAVKCMKPSAGKTARFDLCNIAPSHRNIKPLAAAYKRIYRVAQKSKPLPNDKKSY